VFYIKFVPEIFDFEKRCDLEIRVKGRLRSSEPPRIDPAPMTSYLRYIATISLYHTVSRINGDFSRKSPFFPPNFFSARRVPIFPAYTCTHCRVTEATRVNDLPRVAGRTKQCQII